MYYFLNHMISSRILAALFDLLCLMILFFAVVGVIATISWLRKRKGRRKKK